jgi:DNA-binding transcriptional regulator YdaS (Cro superfamily)
MTLKMYLERKKLSRRVFSEKVGISQSLLCLILQGKRNVTPKIALRIEQATGGKVDRLELLYPDAKW